MLKPYLNFPDLPFWFWSVISSTFSAMQCSMRPIFLAKSHPQATSKHTSISREALKHYPELTVQGSGQETGLHLSLSPQPWWLLLNSARLPHFQKTPTLLAHRKKLISQSKLEGERLKKRQRAWTHFCTELPGPSLAGQRWRDHSCLLQASVAIQYSTCWDVPSTEISFDKLTSLGESFGFIFSSRFGHLLLQVLGIRCNTDTRWNLKSLLTW